MGIDYAYTRADTGPRPREKRAWDFGEIVVLDDAIFGKFSLDRGSGFFSISRVVRLYYNIKRVMLRGVGMQARDGVVDRSIRFTW